MKKKHTHTIERGANPGEVRVVLNKRGGRITPGSSNDPWAISELMALEAIREEADRTRDLEEMTLDEGESSDEVRDSDAYRLAERREKERAAVYHSSDSGSALSRVASGIRSLADVVAGLLDGRAK